jgi:hypothetical protein
MDKAIGKERPHIAKGKNCPSEVTPMMDKGVRGGAALGSNQFSNGMTQSATGQPTVVF